MQQLKMLLYLHLCACLKLEMHTTFYSPITDLYIYTTNKSCFVSDLSEEDSSDEDSLISDSDDSYVLVIRGRCKRISLCIRKKNYNVFALGYDQVYKGSVTISDYDLEEPDNDDVELTVETMPSIEDIPLPPLEDLLPNSLEFYSSLS